MAAYVQAVKDKDPRLSAFSTDIQRIVHDADCLEIIRVYGRWGFNPRYLSFYKMFPEQKAKFDALIEEVAGLIECTESQKLRVHLEHHSSDFYADMLRLVHAGKDRFPALYGYLAGQADPVADDARGNDLLKMAQ